MAMDSEAETGPGTDSQRGRRGLAYVSWVLMACVCIAVLVPAIYSSDKPRLWGIPFFYWWQMLWVILCVPAMGAAYLAGSDR